ncbi:hypothetical protein L1987_11182 [Smallanthus sonchifolius]|uniref:Uncharacterized protein n=1 Tax=Smallanthus sonchifolius TaxID=185202 RepID=A0ACB9JDN7_9ASTR|nr:hypothetical protein L1987_11182 [Smallanthus sonchifolius]
MVKAQTLPEPDKYRPTSPTKYRPTRPTHGYPSKEELPNPNKYQPASPVRNFPLKEGQPIRTQSFLGPNKNHSSGLGEGGRDVRVIDFSSPNYHWQSAGPPTTRHPLKTPTNDINEALGFPMESTNYSPRSDPKREGAFDNLSPRAQPIEHERRYTGPVFGGVTNPTYLRSNTIDSEEAVRSIRAKTSIQILALYQTRMANKTYVTKGYSTYTNIPAQQGGYDHEPRHLGSQYVVEPRHLGNQYVAETKTVGRVRAPAAGYTDYVGSPSKIELLKEYGHSPTMSGGNKYAPKNHYEDYEPNYGLNYENSSPPISPEKHGRGYFSEEPNRVHSVPGYVRTTGGPNKHWPTAGPPATHHPLTTSTNNINEALGLLEESVYNPPRADPRRRGVLDDLATRAQPIEAQSRYARPAFVAKPNDARNYVTNTGSAIDSHEAMRRYHGSLVP